MNKAININQVNNEYINNATDLILSAEQEYKNQIIEACNQIVSNPKYKIVLLAGPSSSGKTTTSNILRGELLKHGFESIVISLDDFFLNRKVTPKLPNGDYDYENITALDLPCLNHFVNDIFEKGTALMPTYNFITGEREKELTKVVVNENTIIIFEGIHALNPILITKHTEAMYKIYIEASSDFVYDDKLLIKASNIRLMRRLNRDFYSRGMTIDGTLKIWQNVLDGENLYIRPYKHLAHHKINSTHKYEPLIYAKELLPLLKKDKNTQNKTKQILINFLEHCNKITKEVIPEGSLLKEFLK